jgi:Phospholipid methyltransferase
VSAGWGNFARRIRVPMGFAFAAFFLWRAHASPRSLILSLLLTLPGVALRAYASGYVTKNTELTTTGPYAYTRNPLYLGSLLLAFGFAAASRSWSVALLLALLFALIYIPTIRSEEEYLRSRFAGFDAYCRRVPRLLPWRMPPLGTVRGSFSAELYRKHREYNATLGTLAMYMVLLLKLLFWHHGGD